MIKCLRSIENQHCIHIFAGFFNYVSDVFQCFYFLLLSSSPCSNWTIIIWPQKTCKKCMFFELESRCYGMKNVWFECVKWITQWRWNRPYHNAYMRTLIIWSNFNWIQACNEKLFVITMTVRPASEVKEEHEIFICTKVVRCRSCLIE